MRNSKIITMILGLLLLSGCSSNEIDKPVNTTSPTPNVTTTPKATATPTVDNESNFDGPPNVEKEPAVFVEFPQGLFDPNEWEFDFIVPLLIHSNNNDYGYSELVDDYYIIGLNGKYGIINEKMETVLNPIGNNYPIGHVQENDLHLNGSMFFDDDYNVMYEDYQQQVKNTDFIICDGHGVGNLDIGYDKLNDTLYLITQGDDGPASLMDFDSEYFVGAFKDNNLIPYVEIANVILDESGFDEFDELGKYGIVKQDKTILTDAIYDDIFDIDGELKPVKKDGLWGYVDNQGNEVIPCIYQATFQSERFYDVDKGEYYQVNPNYPYPLVDGRIVVKNQDDKYGVIDTSGNVLIEFEYDYGSPYYDNSVILKKDGEWIIK